MPFAILVSRGAFWEQGATLAKWPEYTFFSRALETPGQITRQVIKQVSTIKKTEIASIFLDHSVMKLEISNKRKTGKLTNM
jgi:hypothetical protein